MSIYIPTESEEQQLLFEYCMRMRGTFPELDMLAHTPNEGNVTDALPVADKAR